ncbi:MAG: hypothetical protein QM784_34975 [Polyangiaceae bacterium]
MRSPGYCETPHLTFVCAEQTRRGTRRHWAQTSLRPRVSTTSRPLPHFDAAACVDSATTPLPHFDAAACVDSATTPLPHFDAAACVDSATTPLPHLDAATCVDSATTPLPHFDAAEYDDATTFVDSAADMRAYRVYSLESPRQVAK